MALTRFAQRIKGGQQPTEEPLPTLRVTILAETVILIGIRVIAKVRRRSPLGPYGAPARRPPLAPGEAGPPPQPITDFTATATVTRRKHVVAASGTNTAPSTTLTAVVRILEGATPRVARTFYYDAATSLADLTITLTQPEMDSITDWSALKVEVSGTGDQKLKVSNIRLSWS